MDNHMKEIFGAFLAAIGTVSAAIGGTPIIYMQKRTLKDLDIIGNVLQAVGNGLATEGQKELSLETIGNELQSIGNLTVVSGLLLNIEDHNKQELIISGNWIQALGGLTALVDRLLSEITNTDDLYLIAGDLLQAIGNSLQAIDGINELKSNQIDKVNENVEEVESDEYIGVTGGWIQAIGSIISLIGQTKEENHEPFSFDPAFGLQTRNTVKKSKNEKE